MVLELNEKEVICSDFKVYKGHNSFIFGIVDISEDEQKRIKDSINSLKAKVFLEGNILILDIGERQYHFNFEEYIGFFTSKKFYVGFDFVNQGNRIVNDYRRMFTIERKL